MEKRSSLFTAASLRRAEDRRGYQTVRGAYESLWNTVLTKEQLPRNLNSSNGMRLYEIVPLIGWSSRKRVSFYNKYSSKIQVWYHSDSFHFRSNTSHPFYNYLDHQHDEFVRRLQQFRLGDVGWQRLQLWRQRSHFTFPCCCWISCSAARCRSLLCRRTTWLSPGILPGWTILAGAFIIGIPDGESCRCDRFNRIVRSEEPKKFHFSSPSHQVVTPAATRASHQSSWMVPDSIVSLNNFFIHVAWIQS